MTLHKELLKELESVLGKNAVLHQAEDLRLYEYDGGVDKAVPDFVVFPRITDDVVAFVKIAARHKLPIVGRGAGTGLSGGAIAASGGLMISFARMNRILKIDIENERAVVQPGVVNLDLTRAVSQFGYYYAPDPSSQRACTIGGNVAENAGGPHTLTHGVTTNHVTSLKAVLIDGTVIAAGGNNADGPGYDLVGLLTGSEGTLALITEIGVRLVHQAESVQTMLAIYDSTDRAGDTVGAITAQGIIPVALEMLDGPMLRLVEAATHAGYPIDAAAVLLIEVEGLKEEVEEQTATIAQVCKACGARQVRVAQSAEERDLLWKGRKNAFGAIGRVSPTYYVQDGVVPRTKIAETLRAIDAIGKKYAIDISNIFHAGDGNMHPILPFDPRVPGELERAQAAGIEILKFCISVGGSITGEHGVGMEKTELMGHLFSPDTIRVIQQVKDLFDAEGRLNPGKVLPTGKGCLEIRQRPEFVM